MPFLATMPTIMIMPISETTFKVLPVRKSASSTPPSARTAPVTMAIGCAKERNSISKVMKTSNTASASAIANSRKLACCSWYSPPYSIVIPVGSFTSFGNRLFISLIAVPKSLPSKRPVTATICLRFSRAISVWPFSYSISAT
ncbi:MAG: hypothetical protein DMF70_16480 [Acidobacteria bacterium]|nr:MAG: hypothetical protein DMF70_16480 [Acidobacteriota bacterium]